jgi:3-oxoacyl-[acyl-carrier protein] reductase
MDLGLQGKVALVTGGSKGLGAAIARELAQEGAAIAICSRHQSEVEAMGSDIARECGREVLALAADVTKRGDIDALFTATVDRFGALDILVNNAGRATPGTFETLTDEQWQDDLDVKLFSQIRCSRAALSHLRARGGGRIVNVNAVYGKMPDPTFFATSTNRAACLGFTKALAMQLAPENILVNSVNIGFVVTPQWENIWQKRAPDLDREEFFRQMARQDVPMGRFGSADEVAGLVAFLCSRRASYITGASIDVAGGMGKYI